MAIKGTPDPAPSPRLAASPPEASAAAVPEEKEGEAFRLRVTKDRMRIAFDCDTEGKDPIALADAIVAKLVQFGVRKPPTPDWILGWLREKCAAGPSIQDATIVEGVVPVLPIDGRIEWGGDFFNPGFIVDEQSGRINFRMRAGDRNVKAGQLLATILAPVPGSNGIDVTGTVIRVRKPRRPQIRAGENVQADADSVMFYATCDGRIRWDEVTLTVDQIYEVDGDVGLETGDIKHQGAVLVHGDVLEGARLEAFGDIEVHGAVDSAQIQTGGHLHVHGGITGGDGCRAIAAGEVHARYILDAEVQAKGDIFVESEIMHSRISTLGALYMPKGRVIGGVVMALGGIDVGQAGSPALVRTELIAGEDYGLEGQIAIYQNKLKRTQENIDKIYRTIAPMHGKVATLPESSKQAIRLLLARLPGMQATVAEIPGKLDEIRAESRSRARHVILIRNHAFPEVRLSVHREMLVVKDEVAGPVRPKLVGGRLQLALTQMRSIASDARPAGDNKTP